MQLGSAIVQLTAIPPLVHAQLLAAVQRIAHQAFCEVVQAVVHLVLPSAIA